MNYLSLDHCIVYGFLFVTLVIGLWAGRNIKDIQEYAVANRAFSTGMLVLTLLATNIGGGSILGASNSIFSNGIIMTVAELGVAVQVLGIGFFITPHMVRFNNCITMGDVMARCYGTTSRLITGLLTLLYSICMIAMQLLALAIFSDSLLGIKATWVIALSGSILAIYTALGGIKSVTFTDAFQFLVLIIVIPLIISLVVKQVGGISMLLQQVPAEKFNVFEHERFSYYATLFLMWSIFPTGLTSPPIFQRLLMAKEAKQLRNQYLTVAAFDPVFRLGIMLIGLSALVLYPTIAAKNVVPHIIQELLPVGIKGAAIAGLLAVIMSSADSYLHSAGLLLAHDIIKPICDRRKVAIDELACARYGTMLVGIGAIALALTAENLLSLSFAALRFTGPLLMFPLVGSIIGLKADARTFYASALVTLIVFGITTVLLPTHQQHLVVLISTITNGVAFFAMHAMQHGGLRFERSETELKQ